MPRPTDAEVAAVLAAYRIVIAVAARSAGPQPLDPAEVRVLTSAAHSSASRVPAVSGAGAAAQSRLVARGLLQADEGAYRPTDEGLALLADVLDSRVGALDAILGRLPEARRIEITATLSAFTARHVAERVTPLADRATSPAPVSPRPPR